MSIILEALNELDKIDSQLDEDLKGWFNNNYKNLFGNMPEKKVQEMVASLAKLDPTFKFEESDTTEEILKKPQGSYLPWILKLIKKKVTTYEDIINNAHEYKDQLEIYNDLKRRNRIPADKKDLMNPNAGINSIEDLMTFLIGLGGTGNGTGKHSDFKQDIANIRQAIENITGLPEREIPENIQKTDDVFEFLGENDKWEIWGAKNEFATMIFDRWGNGAGWCVGGMLGNRSGRDQWEQAQHYFSNYNKGGATYVCFQQKDKNASRPTNKYLITLGPNGSLPETHAGYQFNDANNSTQYADNEYHYDRDGSQNSQMEAFAEFLQANGLTEIFKKTRFSGCEALLHTENKQRLEDGEPFKYVGGKIRGYFRDAITEIVFVDEEGKEHKVNAREHPEYLECESVNEMLNMENLINGEPYIYDGSEKMIKERFRTLITEIVLPDSYNQEVRWQNGSFIGIPYAAFKGCVNLRKVTFPASVIVLASNCFRVNGLNAPYTDIKLYTPRHRIKCTGGDDAEFLRHHLNYIE